MSVHPRSRRLRTTSVRQLAVVISTALVAAIGVAPVATHRLSAAPATRAVTTPLPEGFVEGTPDLKSAGALTFAPDGTLFVGDSRGGAVYALAIDDRTPEPKPEGGVAIDDLDKRLGKVLSMAPDQVVIKDMAVNPVTQHLYFSVARGRGVDAAPAIIQSTLAGDLSIVPLDNVRYSKLALADSPSESAKTPWGASSRSMAITDLAFNNGELLIAGLSNEQFASTFRHAKFPFTAGAQATTLEIFHTSHGEYETAAPIETFLPYTVNGRPALLAGYGCAPLAMFDMADIETKKHVRGTTLAELGGGNRPSDMVAVEAEGRKVVIIANSDRTMMSMKATDIDKSSPVTTKATRQNPILGTPYIPLAVVGVMQLDVLNPDYIVMVLRDIETGSIKVRTQATKYL
jgi:hypothetical protein